MRSVTEMTLLVGKIFFSVVVVLCLSWIVEHVGPRVAGILAGMPLGAHVRDDEQVSSNPKFIHGPLPRVFFRE